MIQKNEKLRYASDLSDSQWEIIRLLFPPTGTNGKNGLWEKIRAALVERVRIDTGPSYAIIDSQSVKTAYAAEDHGIDGGKNKRTQTAHRSGHNGESAGGGNSCRQYA